MCRVLKFIANSCVKNKPGGQSHRYPSSRQSREKLYFQVCIKRERYSNLEEFFETIAEDRLEVNNVPCTSRSIKKAVCISVYIRLTILS